MTNEFQDVAVLSGLSAGLTFVTVIVLIAVVVFPAVWSRDTERRRAAQAVLRLLLDHWSRRRASKSGRRKLKD